MAKTDHRSGVRGRIVFTAVNRKKRYPRIQRDGRSCLAEGSVPRPRRGTMQDGWFTAVNQSEARVSHRLRRKSNEFGNNPPDA